MTRRPHVFGTAGGGTTPAARRRRRRLRLGPQCGRGRHRSRGGRFALAVTHDAQRTVGADRGAGPAVSDGAGCPSSQRRLPRHVWCPACPGTALSPQAPGILSQRQAIVRLLPATAVQLRATERGSPTSGRPSGPTCHLSELPGQSQRANAQSGVSAAVSDCLAPGTALP